MAFFESVLALLLIAILLLQLSRRFGTPYPAMLAAAGVVIAFVPGAPSIALDPSVALALFVAPALLDAAYDFPLSAIRRLWRPLAVLAIGLVLCTVACVAWIGMRFGGLPLAAAITLGAIVAPPDAAAAVAVLKTATLPRRTMQVLKGESLLNDGTALLLFNTAVTLQATSGFDITVAVHLILAVPGGVALGLGFSWIYRKVAPLVSGTLGGSLLEFVNTFWLWIVAERLGFSAVLSLVAFAVSIARSSAFTRSPFHRIHSFAVWETVVFLLNVVAFLLIGMQVRGIIASMEHGRIVQVLWFSSLVVVGLVVVRMAYVLLYNRLAARFVSIRGDFEAASFRQGIVVGWCGMRGLVTLATALALPGNFPSRDLIVLTAFIVVMATLVVQGLTLAPLIRWLRLDSDKDSRREMRQARLALAEAGLAAIGNDENDAQSHVRDDFEMVRDALKEHGTKTESRRRALQFAAVAAQRIELQRLRDDDQIDDDGFEMLRQEIDWRELSYRSGDEQRVEPV